MKKSIIAASASAVALAAMPALGAFADVTDTVQITIKDACSVGGTTATTGAGKTFTEADAKNGQTYSWDATEAAGGKLVVSCNDASGWNIKAVGSSEGATKTSMKPTGSGTAIATGTATSGATSNWAFKVAGANAVSDYTSFSAVPATATKVATSSATASEETYYTGYQVYVSPTQQADTYTGMVTYTVAKGA